MLKFTGFFILVIFSAINKSTSEDSTKGKEPVSDNVESHPNLKLLPIECGNHDGSSDVLSNSVKAKIEEFPFMALLKYEDDSKTKYRCAGTLISDRYVLIAAHCVNKDLVSVTLGKQMFTNGKEDAEGTDIPIEELVKHPDYSRKNKSNDIALIRLNQPVNSEKNIQPICLPVTKEAQAEVEKLQKAFVTSYGILKRGEISELTKAKVDVNLERQKCIDTVKEKSSGRINITDKYICTSGNTCTESGNPLFNEISLGGSPSKKYIQFGFISFSFSACESEGHNGVGDIYINVVKYLPWILESIRA